MVKNPPATQETKKKQIPSLGLEYSREAKNPKHSSILTEKFHEERSLAGYSPWGRKELDTTEHPRT